MLIYDGLMNGRKKFAYPVEIMKHYYVSVVGGFSDELERREVGINRSALEQNTRLVGFHDRVVLKRLVGNKVKPFFFREPYVVVPLDESTPDALKKSQEGEVVLSEEVREEVKRKRALRVECIGEKILLNSTLSKIEERWKTSFLSHIYHRLSQQ